MARLADWAHVLQSEAVRRECPALNSVPKMLRLTRWPQLNRTEIGVTRQWHFWMQNVDTIEPLAMRAFVGAIQSGMRAAGSGWIIDIGANMGVYSLVGAALAPNFTTVAVDMQPRCAQVTRCHLASTACDVEPWS